MNVTAKTFLFAISAICGASLFVAQAKADDEILDLLNNSETKSPDITWVEGEETDIEILGEYYRYDITGDERPIYTTRQENTLSGDVKADFIGSSAGVYEWGGAVYNDGTIDNLNANFIDNSIKDDGGYTGDAVENGALYNSGYIGNLTGDFVGNHVESVNNNAQEGVMTNDGEIDSIRGNFVGNYAKSENGVALYGVMANYGVINDLVGDFVGNYSEGGTLAYGVLTNQYYDGDYPGIIKNMSACFIDNHAKADEAAAGAIDNVGTLNMIADGAAESGYKKSVVFKGNYVEDSLGKRYEAIYNEAFTDGYSYSNSSITFTAKNEGEYTFYDYIIGNIIYDSSNNYYGGVINFDGDGSGKFNLYNSIYYQRDINFNADYVLNMISPENIHNDTSNFSVIASQNITISAAIQMAVDVDLRTKEIDHFEAYNFIIDENGSVNVTEFNIVDDIAGGVGDTASVEFVVYAKDEEGHPVGIVEGLDKISSEIDEIVNGRYTYAVAFNAETGEFEFTLTNIAPEPVEPELNVAGMANSSAQMMTEVLAAQVLNRDVSAIVGYNSGDVETLSTWIQLFGSDDNVELKNLAGDIDAQFYGVVGGIDSKRIRYVNGFSAVYGIYGSYVGSKQKYENSKVRQNAGYLGVSAAFRKGIFSDVVTLNGGYIANEAETPSGEDKFDTKVVSVSNKAAVDITQGSVTVTPALTLGYIGIDTEDYTAKDGTKYENDFMNVFVVTPELKVMKDFCMGLKGYAKVAYKMFFYDNNKVKANSVLLPAMSVKPYVEYGVGLSKDWSQEEWNPKDATSYAEVMRHDGGREGWDVNLGLKLDF